MCRKLEIVRAFIHHPLILFQNELTIGLDPEARREVWQQIAVLNKEKTTIILTTHYMDEAHGPVHRRPPLWSVGIHAVIGGYGGLILAHIFGRFYWRYRERLDWGL